MNIERPENVPPYERWINDRSYGTSLNNVCNYVRLLNHVGSIVEAMGVAEDASDEASFRPHVATYLKLLLAASYARKFLEVGSRYATKLYYFDVLSASGLTYPGGARTPVPGSAFWVPLAHQRFEQPRTTPAHRFSRVWTFDRSDAALGLLRRRRDRLVERTGFALPPYDYIPGDVNESMLPVLEALAEERRGDQAAGSPGSLTLAFIDNLALDVTMETVRRVQCSIRGDLVVHLPTRAIWRSREQARQTPVEARKLTAFFGSEEAWRSISAAEDIPTAYQACVQRVTGQAFQPFKPVSIRGPHHDFALCIYARKTRGAGNVGWVGSIGQLAEACNRFDDTTLKRVMSVALGQQRRLDLGDAGE